MSHSDHPILASVYPCYDESGESFADIGFNFTGTTFNVGLLDYDPLTGNYLGWLAPAFPDNSFDAGTWHRFEAVIDLNNNTLRLLVDGNDYGMEAGISRATGVGYAGAFLNWGTSFSGSCAIDQISVDVISDAPLPAAPVGFSALLNPIDHGGTVLYMPCGDFSQRGLDWENTNSAQLIYDSIYQGVSVYRLIITEDTDEADARLWSFKTLPVKANRTYEVSALIRTDFPRATWEMNIGILGAEPDGTLALGGRYGGMPAITNGPDGWERWTWRITPHWEDIYEHISVFVGAHEYGPGFNDYNSPTFPDHGLR